MRLTTARDLFIQYRRDGGPDRRPLGPKSLVRYYFALTSFIDWLIANHSRPRRPGDSVLMFTSALVRDYVTHRHAQDVAPATLAVDCAVLRELARWGLKRRYWRPEDVEDMPSVVRPDTTPRPLSDEERDRVMALPLSGDERLLRSLLYYSGAREDELLRLKLLDVRSPHALPDGTVVLGTLRLWGKGSRERYVDIHPDLWAVLGPYLDALRGRLRDWHVLSRDEGQPWTPFMIISRVKNWGKAALVPTLRPHVLRHTFATNVYEQTGDIRVVQELLGHTNVNTTQRYTRVVSTRRASAIMGLPSFVQSSRSVSPDPPGDMDD